MKIVFNFDKPPDNPEMIVITLYATNYSYEPIYDFLFQAAVPKVIVYIFILALRVIDKVFFNLNLKIFISLLSIYKGKPGLPIHLCTY